MVVVFFVIWHDKNNRSADEIFCTRAKNLVHLGWLNADALDIKQSNWQIIIHSFTNCFSILKRLTFKACQFQYTVKNATWKIRFFVLKKSVGGSFEYD